MAINWMPHESVESIDAGLQDLSQRRVSVGRWIRERASCNGDSLGLPQRLVDALCRQAAVDPSATASGGQLTRERRKALANALCNMTLPITGDRGFTHAEVTAGGVPLSEIRLETMESRICPGLHIIGEICDVDGRIGGYNFQWAWASGYIAGISVTRSVAQASRL